MSPTNPTEVTLLANSRSRTWMQIPCSVSQLPRGRWTYEWLWPLLPHLLPWGTSFANFSHTGLICLLEHEVIPNSILGLCTTSFLSLEIPSSKSLHDRLFLIIQCSDPRAAHQRCFHISPDYSHISLFFYLYIVFPPVLDLQKNVIPTRDGTLWVSSVLWIMDLKVWSINLWSNHFHNNKTLNVFFLLCWHFAVMVWKQW